MHLLIFRPHVSWVSIPHEAVSATSLLASLMMANGCHFSVKGVVTNMIIADSNTSRFLMAINRIRSELSVLLEVY
jgi:hypothetical protein